VNNILKDKIPKNCNKCNWVKLIDVVPFEWIEAKCQLSLPEKNKLIKIIKMPKDKISKPSWCPLVEVEH
jgi:hypothetical protein